jgi:hypothetical protein
MYNLDNRTTTENLIQFLKADVAPALGCTEPVCVALCAAHAAACLEENVTRIQVEVNANIYKNGMSAGIPNFDHVGLEYAAALGALLKNPDKKLELLEDITASIRENTLQLVSNEQVCVRIDEKQALILRDNHLLIGAMAFSVNPCCIDFLGVHPQYKQKGIQKLFLDALMTKYLPGQEISMTTYREGDKADTGHRALLMQLGFAERELLTEFGYPTQRFALSPCQEEENEP